MESIVALSELKKEINELNIKVAELTKGMTFSLNELIDLSVKMESLELLELSNSEGDSAEALFQLQAGMKQAIASKIGHNGL